MWVAVALSFQGRSDSSSSSPLQRLSSGLDLLAASSSPSSGCASTPSLIGGSAFSPHSVTSRVFDASSPVVAGSSGRDEGEGGGGGGGVGVGGSGGGGSLALRVLVDGNRDAKSWREKLEVVRRLLLTGFKDGKFRTNQEDTGASLLLRSMKELLLGVAAGLE